MGFIIASTVSYTISRFGEQGLADLFGLTTLRHGTDPLSWAIMHIKGASPSNDLSGSFNPEITPKNFALIGSTRDYKVTFPDDILTKQNLSFLPDIVADSIISYQKSLLESTYTEYLKKAIKIALPILERGPIFYIFKKTIMYSLVTLQKGISTFNRLSNEQDGFKTKIGKITASVLSCLTPTLKIRKCDSSDLQNPYLVNVIMKSKTGISFHDIGLIGTVTNGVKNCFGLPSLFKDPALVIKRVVKLTLTAGFVMTAGTVAPRFIAAHQTAIIAGAIFGVL